MEIKISKKVVYVIISIIVLVGIFGLGMRLSNQNTTTPSIKNPSQSPSVIKSNENLPSQNVREIQVTAKQFEFSPNPIQVRLGEFVRLQITSVDVAHGFSLAEFGIDEILEPGQTVSVEFQATKKGEFPFACSVSCGSGHLGMRGVLIVE